jgi:hypothetical protein
VLREIEHIVENFAPAEIQFSDDLFTTRPSRVLRLCEGIAARGLHTGRRFRAFARANHLTDEILTALASIHCNILDMGFESGSDHVLQLLNKRDCTAGVNQRAVDLARAHGVGLASCFILGTPGETRDDIVQTFDFVTRNLDAFTEVVFCLLQVMPGTQVWQWAKQVGVDAQHLAGVVLEPEDLADEDHFNATRWPYLNEDLIPRAELLNLLAIGRRIAKAVPGFDESVSWTPESQIPIDVDVVARQTPLADIVRAKVRRWLRRRS